jgi:hypothetical protein
LYRREAAPTRALHATQNVIPRNYLLPCALCSAIHFASLRLRSLLGRNCARRSGAQCSRDARQAAGCGLY